MTRFTQERGSATARPIWTGSIGFGLVSIPVALMSGEEEKRLSFHLLDRADNGRIGYRLVNKATGNEVTRDRVVKGFEYEPGRFVVITPKDFALANPKKTRTVELKEFVDLEQIDPILFERPYYLVPLKGGEKAYFLLRTAMSEMGKVGIATFVLRDRERLAALVPRGDFLLLETLRFAHEVLDPSEAASEYKFERKPSVSKRELEMATALIGGLESKWDPGKYKNTFHDDLKRMVRAKIKGGKTIEALEAEASRVEAPSKIHDLMPLLKKSLERSARQTRSRHGPA